MISINRVEDEFAFLGLMGCLLEQVTRMNAATALCPVESGGNNTWKDWVEPALTQLRQLRESSKTLEDAAKVAVAGGLDGNP